MKGNGAVVLAALLTACGGRETPFCNPFEANDPDCDFPPPTCDELLRQGWPATGAEFPMGESRQVSLSSFGGYSPLTVCADRVLSLAWEVSDTSVASLAPQAQAAPRWVWVTGVSPGRAFVTARIRFVDGSERMAGPADMRIVPPAGPPGALLIASGRLTFPGASGVCTATSSSCSHENFDVPTAGRVDVMVDWGSPLNNAAFNVFPGHCSGVTSCGAPLGFHTRVGAKPARASSSLQAGPYTLRVSNGGPGPETVRYEVWLTP